MKRLFFLCFLVACSLTSVRPVAAQSASNLRAQQQAIVRVGEALESVVQTAKKVTGNVAFRKQYGTYGFLEDGCVFGARLQPGKSASEGFSLQSGQSYIFIGGGDKTARNLELVISDSRGRAVKRSTNKNKTSPFVLFEPKASGRYKMTLRLKGASGGSAFCSASVLRRGGASLPLERITQATQKVGVASVTVFSTVGGGRFTQDNDTWAIYGAVLKSKQRVASDPKRYRPANRGIVAVGDDRIKDLDLVLLKGGTQAVAADTKNGGVAGIVYATSASSTYSVGLINNYSSGPALVMAVLVDLPANFRLPVRSASQSASGNSTGVPARAPHSVSPFAGRWRGDWGNKSNLKEGSFTMTVQPDGSLTGQLYNATVNTDSPVRGTLNANGVIAFSFVHQGVNHSAQGRLAFDEVDDLSGRLVFSANGQAFGSAFFVLSQE